MSRRQQLKIGLFGFGCVGYGLYRVLQQSASFKAEIKTICVKQSNKKRPLPEHCFVYDPERILSDPDINVVVELTDDSEAAFQLLKRSLQSGKAFVTANKKMLAEHFEAVLELQKATGIPVLYEAAACAGIPIIRNLEEYYDNDFLSRIEGIINGSTNYILSRMHREGLSYHEALEHARLLGYAESNPALDVEGTDARNKLLILCAHAFGVVPEPESIWYTGIENLGRLELLYAAEKKLKIKLLARAVRFEDQSVAAIVAPAFIPQDSPLYGVDGVYNGVITETAFADRQFFSGKGAGDLPTASAVLSDLSALSYQYRYEYKKISGHAYRCLNTAALLDVFVRGRSNDDALLRPFFDELRETFYSGADMYLTGRISLRQLACLKQKFPGVSVVICGDVLQPGAHSGRVNVPELSAIP